MAKIIHDENKCIGCGTCVAVCPKFWEMGENGKSKLKGAKDKGNGIFELEVDNVECNKEAESSCPVQAIRIEE